MEDNSERVNNMQDQFNLLRIPIKELYAKAEALSILIHENKASILEVTESVEKADERITQEETKRGESEAIFTDHIRVAK